jgi:hypothetical protein
MEAGKTIINTDSAFSCLLMEINIRETGSITRDRVKEN